MNSEQQAIRRADTIALSQASRDEIFMIDVIKREMSRIDATVYCSVIEIGKKR